MRDGTRTVEGGYVVLYTYACIIYNNLTNTDKEHANGFSLLIIPSFS